MEKNQLCCNIICHLYYYYYYYYYLLVTYIKLGYAEDCMMH